jgi:hypothetical protein
VFGSSLKESQFFQGPVSSLPKISPVSWLHPLSRQKARGSYQKEGKSGSSVEMMLQVLVSEVTRTKIKEEVL